MVQITFANKMNYFLPKSLYSYTLAKYRFGGKMKKFLLTLMVFGITSSSTAFGYYEVNYMSTGAPKNFTPVTFGSNAPWLPGNREYHSQRAREIRRFNAETEAIKNMHNKNINLNITTNEANNNNSAPTVTTTKTIKKTPATCNGVTYYSGNNPCSL